jgi:hypothetical protein
MDIKMIKMMITISMVKMDTIIEETIIRLATNIYCLQLF